MEILDIKEWDLKESFIRSSAPGGQNVNKVSSCVQLKHIPTGIAVKCQMFRSQERNRLEARRLLLEEIKRRKEESAREKIYALEKIRRQKRNRSKKGKERILADKRLQSEKRKGRQPIRVNILKED